MSDNRAFRRRRALEGRQPPALQVSHLVADMETWTAPDWFQVGRLAGQWVETNKVSDEVKRSPMPMVMGAVEYALQRAARKMDVDPQLQPMEAMVQEIGRVIAGVAPPGVGFCLMMFSMGPGGWSTFLSNAERTSMIAGVEELIAKLKEEAPPTTKK